MVAVWWWRLVARAAPYQDELDRSKGRAGQTRGDEGVVVVGEKGRQAQGHPQAPHPQAPANGDVKS